MVNQEVKGMNDLILASQNVTRAINNLNQTIASIFPNGLEITASAGSSSGKYLTITGSDGNTYKIALLDPS